MFAAAFMSITMFFGGAAFACETLKPGPKGRVVEVTDGDTVILDGGEKIRLIGMQAPKLPLGRVGFEKWPFADEAQVFLSAYSLGKNVRIYYGGARKDRHGRVLGHMFVDDDREKWAQIAMIGAGLARVYSFSDNRHCLDELLMAERQARTDRKGIWAHPYYKLRDAHKPQLLEKRDGYYELVEGRIFDVGDTTYRVYLNFGREWKTDFTVVIDRRAVKQFTEAGIDLQKIEGALVRVRGWIDVDDGPRIDVTHPEQIEILALK
ncbi:MAG: endonuclease YncB(thermonuclease family) [Maritalea sp.]|jgi:endonuclease YncB( thermonuclease family)